MKPLFPLFILLVYSFFTDCSNSRSNTVVLVKPKKQVNLNQIDSNATSSEQIKKEQRIRNELDSLFQFKHKFKGFNGNVLIARKGIVYYENSFGFADFKTKKKLTVNSEFQLGSSSKPLTALAILILMEQRKLNLNQTVDHFIPNFPYKGITIKQLLTHRSGLPNYMYFCDNLYCCQEKALTNNELLELMISKHPPKYYPADKKFEYCNTNYSLLVNIIEKTSGMSYPQFMKENIFKPLNMNHTWVSHIDSNKAHLNKTIGHKANCQHYNDDYLDGILGDKNIFTTTRDLFLFDRALYETNKIINDSTKVAAYTGASHEHPGKRNYGFGWRLIEGEDGEKIIYHNGWWHGYNNVFYRRINDETLVIILSNKITKGIYNIEDVLKIIDNTEVNYSNKAIDDDDK